MSTRLLYFDPEDLVKAEARAEKGTDVSFDAVAVHAVSTRVSQSP